LTDHHEIRYDITHFDSLKPSDGQKFDLETRWWTADSRTRLQSNNRYSQCDSAADRNGTVRMPMGIRIGAIWWIRLNCPCAAAIRSYVKLLWPFVITVII